VAIVIAKAITSAAVRLKMLLRFILAKVGDKDGCNHNWSKVLHDECNDVGDVRFYSTMITQLVRQ
jgi:hypothetical protein